MENGTGENREEGAKPARRPQYRRPRRVPKASKTVKTEEKEGTENQEMTVEPKAEERRKAAPARGRQQGTRKSLPAVKEAGERNKRKK